MASISERSAKSKQAAGFPSLRPPVRPPRAFPRRQAPREGPPASAPAAPRPGRVTFSLFCLQNAAGRSPRQGRASSGDRRRPPRPPGGSGHGPRPLRSPEAPPSLPRAAEPPLAPDPPSSARSPRAWPSPGCPPVPPLGSAVWGAAAPPGEPGGSAPFVSSSAPGSAPRLGSVPRRLPLGSQEGAPRRKGRRLRSRRLGPQGVGGRRAVPGWGAGPSPRCRRSSNRWAGRARAPGALQFGAGS